MLKQRVITACVMMTVFIAVVVYSPWYVFALFTGAIVGFAVWEWANLAGMSRRINRAIYTLLSVLLGLSLAWYLEWVASTEKLQYMFVIACAWWAVALLWIQGYPSSSILWSSTPVRALMGWLVLIPAWLAFIYIRKEPFGSWLVIMLVLIVAAADVGAYFSGRAFGKRKLAPKISPGKSWEGVWGGMLLAICIGVLFNFLFGHGQWMMLLAVVLPTAFVSVVGDLLESMVKRFRGVKDSSQLLPGHGGVLDRIDGLVAAAPVFSLALMATQWKL